MVEPSELLANYDLDNIAVATVCSHTSLQIFHGARLEGFRTIGITLKNRSIRYYDAFPRAKPDLILKVDDFRKLETIVPELTRENAILVPHGSFVEYTTPEVLENLPLPIFGNRKVLRWESNRKLARSWLVSAGIRMPHEFESPTELDRPALIKGYGAKGGRGFFIVKDYEEFKSIEPYLPEKYIIQEYILGTRYYIHYFYSPLKSEGYRIEPGGSIELLSMDRRDETNIDEIYKLGSKEELKRHNIFPTFVVTGNIPVVIRESLLPEVFTMGENVVKRSIELFGGVIGPFCLETVVTDKLQFYVFEISARIVAGTNPFISGSPYADLIGDRLSTGRRIAQELRWGIENDSLEKIIS